ncbi:NmrA family NAD(P)-binding protein [Pontibacter sp. KCTC 32443]|uniref:SDR family oxidoreductase n=1 Tax=Pontibacter TaxID=323449 RepID=UPI00164E5EC1|nr:MULTISPECIES: NmrA family NAD(P)-binding protein [Pontibacter]MBC5773036.1 NmrA family NAD(P)-binding protein [Pontibacter sp. KCTC 32443]
MKVLVIGGTGTVGSQAVKELLARDVHVRVLTRSAEKAETLPPGVEPVVGDILDPKTVRSVFNDIEGVFMVNPVSTTETSEGLFAVNGARMAHVKRFVYMSVHDYEKAVYLPHFGAKLPIEEAIKASGMEYTLLRPNNFYQNDYWYKDAMLKYGIYPQPIGNTGISRVDVRDIAEAAVIALTTSGHEGETYNLVGPEVQTGQHTAEVWSKALGTTIKYGGDDMDAWEQQSLQYLPSWMVFDFRLMYEFFQNYGLKATSEDIERLTKVLGHAPRRFEDFAIETAQKWVVMA